MKLISIFIFFFSMQMISAQTLSWSITHPVSKQNLSLGEKGTVQEKLISIGELPDPFYGENEKEFAWIEEHEWEFLSDFSITEEQLKAKFVEVEFPSIDTYAKIYLNDSLIAKTDNAFYLHHFQIKSYLKVGHNQFRVVFTPPILYHKEAFDKMSSKLPAPNDVGKIGVASMSRKPQYQFGWDWALRMNTIGFWKPACVIFFDENRIIQAKYETIKLVDKAAEIKLSIEFANKTSQNVLVKSELFGEREANIKNGLLELNFNLSEAKLWWPNGHNPANEKAANLYFDEILLYNDKNSLFESRELHFGVRTTELVQEKDQWGISFYFKINGKKIFAKGANFIPQDVFPSRITEESTINIIEQAYKANFNMIRVWGGGFYPDDIFYETCDQLGLMVWQDLMFACAMYPGDEAFLKSVEKELSYQIPRISAHPSVVYFNGNNEVDVAWKNWGFQVTYLIGPKMQNKIEEDYRKLFKDLAPKTIAKFTNIPYVHTSPLSNWGKDEYFNHGTMHYWGVWHGKDPIEDFGLKSGRFNAEYGFQSFPEYSTLKTFSEEKDWDLNSSVMKHHQKSYVGNGMIKKHADNLYGETKDFKEFVYFSQLTQAKAVGIAISGHRTDFPRTMGTLFWQLNDCWPAPTWSSIDYNNNWKALHYQAKADYENVGILERTQVLGKERYYFVSDLDTDFVSNIAYKVFDLKGKELFENYFTIHSKPYWIQEIARECHSESFQNANYVVQFSWTKHDGSLLNRTFFHQAQVKTKAPRTAFSFELMNMNVESKTAQIKITNSEFLADFWVYSSKTGIHFDKNFVHLLPGEHIFTISFSEIPEKSDFDFQWR